MQPHENWEKISGWEGYEVSNKGNVRSFKVPPKWEPSYNSPPRMLKPENRNGYKAVLLCDKLQGRKKVNVNILVLEAFVGKRPTDKHQCCHNDGNKINNNLFNLRWDTPKENNKDKISHGTHQFGEEIGSSKLLDEDVRLIRKLRASGVKCKDVASMFGVCRNTITNITSGAYWKLVK